MRPEQRREFNLFMQRWTRQVQDSLKGYLDLAYNTHSMLKDYYTYEEITWMPLKDLMRQIEIFKPRFREIAQRQQQERMKQEFLQKREAAKQNRMMGVQNKYGR